MATKTKGKPARPSGTASPARTRKKPDPSDALGRASGPNQPGIKRLLRDAIFISTYEKLAKQLRVAIDKDIGYVTEFFSTFGTLVQANSARVEKFIEQTNDSVIKDALQSYLLLSSRFQVALRLKANKFQLVSLCPEFSYFHANLKKGRLHPVDAAVDVPIVWQERYSTSSLDIPIDVRRLVEKKAVKVFRIDDCSEDSLLRDLESAYDPGGLVFIIHAGSSVYRPVLFCMIGESASVSNLWKPAGRVVTAFQKHLFGRVKSGRPRNMKRFAQVLKQRAQPGRLKSKVQVPKSGTAKDVASGQSFISRVDQKSRADTER